MPLDITTGTPLRYQLLEDGTYSLYSLGWNGIDDDGETAWKGDQPNLEEGDWVWKTLLPERRQPSK